MMLVREPTVSDADAIGLVHVRAWQAAYRGGLMPDDHLDGLDVGERARLWEEGLQRPSRPRFARFVVEDAVGTVVGVATAGPADGDTASETGQVYVVNVDPDAWGRAYGRALLDAGVTALRDAGFDAAVLWVHPGNERARRFYERHGWTCDGAERSSDVLGVEVTEVRYVHQLQPDAECTDGKGST